MENDVSTFYPPLGVVLRKFIQKLFYAQLAMSLLGVGPACFSMNSGTSSLNSVNPNQSGISNAASSSGDSSNSPDHDERNDNGGAARNIEDQGPPPIEVASNGVQPLDPGILAPQADVGEGTGFRVYSNVSICSTKNKIRVYLNGYGKNPIVPPAEWDQLAPGTPFDNSFFEEGRILRIVDRNSNKFVDTKIKLKPLEYAGQKIHYTQEGSYEVQLVLDQFPLKYVGPKNPIISWAVSSLFFSLSDTVGMVPDSELDQTKPCPTSVSCTGAHWEQLEAPALSTHIIEAAKKLTECDSLFKTNTLSKDSSASE